MGSETKETREAKLDRLASELSADVANRVKVIESLLRDVSLGAEQMLMFQATRLRMQRAKQLERAYEIGEKLDAAIAGDEVNAGVVASLLFIKTVLVADIAATMEDFDGVLKVLATAAKDLSGGTGKTADVPYFGPRKRDDSSAVPE